VSASQLVDFEHGRCGRREKSGGPALLNLSLKVKWNNVHNQSSAFVDAQVLRPQRACSIKGPYRAHRRHCQSRPATVEDLTIESLEQVVILNRRAQAGGHPFHRSGFGDDLIDVITINALKRAQLGADARGPDLRQHHWPPTFGTWVGLNRDAAWIKQDSKRRHSAHQN